VEEKEEKLSFLGELTTLTTFDCNIDPEPVSAVDNLSTSPTTLTTFESESQQSPVVDNLSTTSTLTTEPATFPQPPQPDDPASLSEDIQTSDLWAEVSDSEPEVVMPPDPKTSSKLQGIDVQIQERDRILCYPNLDYFSREKKKTVKATVLKVHRKDGFFNGATIQWTLCKKVGDVWVRETIKSEIAGGCPDWILSKL
jgi:hypothetical protein